MICPGRGMGWFAAALSAGLMVLLLVVAGRSAPSEAPAIRFSDVTSAAGIHFVHYTGAFGKKYLPETLGSGCAFLDYNQDGRPDIVLINGMDWPGHRRGQHTLKLYRNNGNGTFTDVTRRAGLAVELYGMGVTVGDYDNDGFDDLFITALSQNHLFHNNGDGTFTDVTRRAGLEGVREFSTSAAWVDYDRDGHLDLVVANYVQWSPKTDLFCTMNGRDKSYCTPESYKGASVRLWHNRGNGTFEDATRRAGLYDPASKALGVAVLDYDQDGWPDLFIANDTQPNKLYHNNRRGGFTENGVLSGVAFSENGVARAGMGVDAADYDRSGYPSLLVSNFSNQMLALDHNEGNGLFVDEAPRSVVGRATLLTLGFGCFFFDYDLDGWPDIFVANGQLDSQIEQLQGQVTYAEPPHLFRNLGAGKFQEVSRRLGSAFTAPRVARGAAYADYDGDGDLDLLLTTNSGPSVLLRNDGGENRSLRVRLVGTRSNRDGIGAVVRVTSGGDGQWLIVHSGSSYLSQSELVLTFGLADQGQADTLEVRWPSGHVDRLAKVAAGETVTIREGGDIVSRQKFQTRTQK